MSGMPEGRVTNKATSIRLRRAPHTPDEAEPLLAFQALAAPARAAILYALASGPLTVREIMQRTELVCSTVHTELKILRNARLVESDGPKTSHSRRRHRIVRVAFGRAVDYLQRLADPRLDARDLQMLANQRRESMP